MNKHYLLILFFITSAPWLLYAQNDSETVSHDKFIQQAKAILSEKIILPYPEKTNCPFKVIFSGYVKYEALFDSRQIVSFRDDQLLLYPARRLCDACGRDINDKGHSNMLAIESRLRFAIIGPDVFNAKSLGLIEGDFLGPTDSTINGFRLRHAFANLHWENASFLAGQYWHPMFVPECYPDTLSFNGGNPIEVFSREPQIRITPKIGNANLILAALSQVHFVSDGPQGPSSIYARNAVIPNLHAQLQLHSNDHVFGFGFDYKRLVPRIVTDNNYKVTEYINSTGIIAYAGLNWPDFTFNTKIIYGGNLANFTSLGGYAVTCTNVITEERHYTNLNTVALWIDTALKKTVEPGIFAGFIKNLGASKTIITDPNLIYAFGQEDIDYVLRVSPRVRWFVKPIVFAGELEYTRASFGTATNRGKVINTYPTNNVRLQLAVFYVF